MTKVDVTVINKSFKGIPVGGSTSVSEKDARILVALKRVARGKAEPTYQTRMMTAQAHPRFFEPDAEGHSAPAEPEVFVTPPAEPQKRQYIRRKPLDAPADDAQTE